MVRKMKMKKVWVLLLSVVLLFSIGTSVFADGKHEIFADGKHEKKEHHERNEYYEKWDDDDHDHHDRDHDDDHEKYYRGNNGQEAAVVDTVQSQYWNIWSRQPVNDVNKKLPITTPGNLSASINGKVTKLYFIPQDGEMLVSGEAIAEVLGAETKFYPLSKILVLKNEKQELIVRADSNAAYENKVKNPMPVKATAYEKTVYLPVSVAANALGYRITWNEEKKTLFFTSI